MHTRYIVLLVHDASMIFPKIAIICRVSDQVTKINVDAHVIFANVMFIVVVVRRRLEKKKQRKFAMKGTDD